MPLYQLSLRIGRFRRSVRVSASSGPEAVEIIERHRRGRVISVRRVRMNPLADRRVRIPVRSLTACFDSLEFLIAAGSRVDSAIRSMTDRLPHRQLRHIWVEVLADLEATGSFSRALGRYPCVFDETVVGIALAAETSGRMLDGVRHIGAYLRQMAEIDGQVRRGLVYPTVLLVLSTGTVGVLCWFTLPRYRTMLVGMGVERYNPITTGFFWISSQLRDRPALALGLLPIFMTGWHILRRPSFRRGLSRLVRRVPVVSAAIDSVVMARICVTFVGLHDAGFRAIEALGMCGMAAGNVVYREGLATVVRGVQENLSLGDAIERAGVFSPEFAVAVRAGESDLGKAFARLGQHYCGDAKVRIETALKLLEPALLLLVIVVVFGTALAVILPMVDILEGLHS